MLLTRQAHAVALTCCLLALPPAPAALAAGKGRVLFVASNVLDMDPPHTLDMYVTLLVSQSSGLLKASV